MCLLLSFNKYVFVPILLDWLDGKDSIKYSASLSSRCDCDMFQSVLESHLKLFQHKLFGALSLSTFSHHMVRWAKARQFDLHEFKLVIDPRSNIKDFNAITSEIGYNDHRLKTKFECMSVVHKLDVRDASKAKQSNVIARLLQCFTNLQEISLVCCSAYQKVSQYCLHLRHLDISHANKYIDKFVLVFHCCKQLEHFGARALETYYSSKRQPNLTNYIDRTTKRSLLLAIIAQADNLHSLDFQCIDFGGLFNLITLYGTRRPLTKLSLRDSVMIEHSLIAFAYYRGAALESLCLLSCPYLGTDFNAALPVLTTVVVESYQSQFATTVPFLNIKTLKSFTSTSILESTVIPCLFECDQLETLSIRPNWSAQNVAGIDFKWHNLITLSVYYCEAVPKLLKYCTALKNLTIHSWSYYGAHPVLIEDVMPHLETLNILGLSDTMNINLGPLLVNCPSLITLYCTAKVKALARTLFSEKVNISCTLKA